MFANLNLQDPNMLPDDRDLVQIASFEFEHQAILFRDMLNEHGIPAWVTRDGVAAFGSGCLVEVEVSIHKINVEAANKVLASLPKEKVVPPWTCSCGAAVDEGFSICWSCGADLEELKKL